ncbi:MAG: hypothetical protein CME06_17625 [Gemmatimonadetes bacterium]|nr:hypothetical protein [Gemmatimonadota bacterium]
MPYPIPVLSLPFALAATIGAGESELDQKVFEAEVVCIGCELKRSAGVDAQCSVYAKHEHGLLMESGQIWSILDNETGHGLRTDHDYLTRRVRVSAVPLPRAQYMDIRSVELLPTR